MHKHGFFNTFSSSLNSGWSKARGQFDYYSFGSIMPGRHYQAASTNKHRYGFNGQEMDDEVSGQGDNCVFLFRTYDSRIGRFFSIDPLFAEFPWNSPYSFAENKVMENKELEGGETVNATMFDASGVLVLQIANTNGPLQIVPGGPTNIPANEIRQQSVNLIGKGEHKWGNNYTNTNSSFNNTKNVNGTGSFYQMMYRPILWKSFRDGVVINDPVVRNNNRQSRTFGITIGTDPLNVRIRDDIRIMTPMLTNYVNNNDATVGNATPINNTPPATNVANIPTTDFAGNIAINQNTSTVGNNTITAVANYTLTIGVNPADVAQANGIAAGLRGQAFGASGTNIQVNVVQNNAIPAGSLLYRMSHTETTTEQTTTTTRTTATVASPAPRANGNIPQGN